MRRALKILGWAVGSISMLLLLIFVYLLIVTDVEEPKVDQPVEGSLIVQEDGLRRWGNNWFRKSESGLFEMYVEGDAYERGYIIGQLSKALIQYQEEVFNKQIRQLVPSSAYLNGLKYFVGWFNRDLDESVPREFREEIFGVSRVASHDFDYIAPPYQRMLNYHAAHDIGHALQNMALVGCTAFATWSGSSEDSTLIIGRNFDFYVGDDFAKNKIVAFYAPADGYKFMMLTFGGMTGVLSGMNEHGLTVTLNAAKSEIPSGSATPVSLVAREMLQYAATIDEAYAIAKKRETFVAEAFLIGSANDHKAAIIEKSPSGIDIYFSTKDRLVGTNHFQSPSLKTTSLNEAHMQASASVHRYKRVEELLAENKNSVSRTATILRDQKGKGGIDIGMGNERAINQLIAHHGIIFKPQERKVWVSTDPFQLGKFVCYDLNRVFDLDLQLNKEITNEDLSIAEDPFVHSEEYKKAVKFNQFRFPFQSRADLDPDSLVMWNPNSYLSYLLAGDWHLAQKNYAKAAALFEIGMEKEVATAHEREHMEEKLRLCKEKLQ